MIQRNFLLVFVISVLLQSSLAAKCYQCDSVSNPNCIEAVTKIDPTDCDKELCYSSVDANGKVTRGCRDDACNSDDCKSCDGENCNKQNVCQTCDSSKDAKCAQSNSVENAFNKICTSDTTKCLININKDNKHTERRCASADDACTDDKTCKTCAEPNCNKGIFPADRRLCYQCSGEKNSNCNTLATNGASIDAEPCLLYASDEKCYMFATSETTVVRGCVSDAGDTNKCSKPESNELCLACEGSKCNNYNYKRDQQLKCLQCTTTETDNKCKLAQAAGDAKNCKNPIEYSKAEQCYTQYENNTVYRGCLYDREAALGECKKETNCETCDKEDGCNKNEINDDFTCKRCRSDNDWKCYNEADKLGGEKCINAVNSDNEICFHGVWKNVAIRGCLVDADEQTRAICLHDGNNECKICKGKDCNTKKSGAANLTAFSTILMIFFIMVVRWF